MIDILLRLLIVSVGPLVPAGSDAAHHARGECMNDARYDPEAPDERTIYSLPTTRNPAQPPTDLRTIDQRERDDVAALRAELDAHRKANNEALTTMGTLHAHAYAAMRRDVTDHGFALARLTETLRLVTGPIDVALRCDSLQEQLESALRRVKTLEERERAHAAAIERLADAVQVLAARAGEGE